MTINVRNKSEKTKCSKFKFYLFIYLTRQSHSNGWSDIIVKTMINQIIY